MNTTHPDCPHLDLGLYWKIKNINPLFWIPGVTSIVIDFPDEYYKCLTCGDVVDYLGRDRPASLPKLISWSGPI